jgi:hypothetical protein
MSYRDGYTQEQWDKLKAEFPHRYRDIPIDEIYIVCEKCGRKDRCVDTKDACEGCGMRYDEMTSW